MPLKLVVFDEGTSTLLPRARCESFDLHSASTVHQKPVHHCLGDLQGFPFFNEIVSLSTFQRKRPTITDQTMAQPGEPAGQAAGASGCRLRGPAPACAGPSAAGSTRQPPPRVQAPCSLKFAPASGPLRRVCVPSGRSRFAPNRREFPGVSESNFCVEFLGQVAGPFLRPDLGPTGQGSRQAGPDRARSARPAPSRAAVNRNRTGPRGRRRPRPL